MHAMTSLEELTKRHITLPLAHVKEWSPFQIDALGLVTLLGADEVNQSVGTLQHRRYTEYLPLLAAFVIAGDRFVTEQPGFVLYNLTDGITSTELKGWFTRWLMSQKVNNATTVLEWQRLDETRGWEKAVAPALSFVLVMPLLVITILVGDWYGVGNAAAIIISILTRVYLLQRRRHARDTDAYAPIGKQNPEKTLCIIRSDGKMVTCKVPQSVLRTFVKSREVDHHKSYHCARWLCWLALGVHMCILGMCSLFTQIYTVFLLVLSTWWFTSDFFWDIGRQRAKGPADRRTVITIPFNKHWTVDQTNHSKETSSGEECDKRQYAWARLNLDAGAEQAMKAWNLFPIDAKNPSWFPEYEGLKKSLREEPPGVNEKRPAASTIQGANISPPRSRATSTLPLMEGGSPLTPSRSSLNPTSAGADISRTSTPGDTQTTPAGGV